MLYCWLFWFLTFFKNILRLPLFSFSIIANKYLILIFCSLYITFSLTNSHIYYFPHYHVFSLSYLITLSIYEPFHKTTYITKLKVFWPKVGEGGKWTASITSNASTVEKIEAITKPECVYKICVGLAGGVQPSYNNFTKWFCYPSNHPEISNMTVGLEHTLELLPLQNFIDRQLFTNRVELKLEVQLSNISRLFVVNMEMDHFVNIFYVTGKAPLQPGVTLCMKFYHCSNIFQK